jgi:hypothetical protein
MLRITTMVLLLALSGIRGGQPFPQDSIEVHLRLLRAHGDTTDFDVTVSNKSGRTVYVMTNPQRADRSSGPYFASDENDPTLLRCEFRTFPAPPYDLYFNGTHVELKRLLPGENSREEFSVGIPIMRTVPPYGNAPGKPEAFANHFRRIKAVVGILPASEGLNKLFEKLGTHLVHGLEPIAPDDANSQRIFEAQTLLTSNIIEF